MSAMKPKQNEGNARLADTEGGSDFALKKELISHQIISHGF